MICHLGWKSASDAVAFSFEKKGLPLPETVAAVTYSKDLNMQLEDYRGKKVPDAGSGFGKFKSALATLGIDASV